MKDVLTVGASSQRRTLSIAELEKASERKD